MLCMRYKGESSVVTKQNIPQLAMIRGDSSVQYPLPSLSESRPEPYASAPPMGSNSGSPASSIPPTLFPSNPNSKPSPALQVPLFMKSAPPMGSGYSPSTYLPCPQNHTANSGSSATSIPPTLFPPNPNPKSSLAIPSTSPALQVPVYSMCATELPQISMEAEFAVVPHDRESTRKVFEVLGFGSARLDVRDWKLTLTARIINAPVIERMFSRISFAKTLKVGRAEKQVRKLLSVRPAEKESVGPAKKEEDIEELVKALDNMSTMPKTEC